MLETERLLIRRITYDDFDALLAIMGKKEVMYAWEHGFSHDDVRGWIERQLVRYAKDGIGYFAVILKASGRLIGQVGLMNTMMRGEKVVEVGYIFDNMYWHKGYALEATQYLVGYAFDKLGLAAVYCSIRPENRPSVRVAEKLGMLLFGSHTVVYNGKKMPHLIYKLNP